MKHQRAWLVVLTILIAIVSAFAGVVITGLVIGVKNDVGAGVIQLGTPILLAFTVLLVVASLLFARLRQTGRS